MVGSVPAGGSGLVKDVTRTSRAWNANSGRESFFHPPAATGRRSKENASCYGKDFNAATKHESDEPPGWETFAARLSLIAMVRKAEQKSDALPYATGKGVVPNLGYLQWALRALWCISARVCKRASYQTTCTCCFVARVSPLMRRSVLQWVPKLFFVAGEVHCFSQHSFPGARLARDRWIDE